MTGYLFTPNATADVLSKKSDQKVYIYCQRICMVSTQKLASTDMKSIKKSDQDLA
jgi:hypothetical protein